MCVGGAEARLVAFTLGEQGPEGVGLLRIEPLSVHGFGKPFLVDVHDVHAHLCFLTVE